jgi:hypothetical protein
MSFRTVLNAVTGQLLLSNNRVSVGGALSASRFHAEPSKNFSQTLGSRQASCSAVDQGTKGDRRSSCVVRAWRMSKREWIKRTYSERNALPNSSNSSTTAFVRWHIPIAQALSCRDGDSTLKHFKCWIDRPGAAGLYHSRCVPQSVFSSLTIPTRCAIPFATCFKLKPVSQFVARLAIMRSC